MNITLIREGTITVSGRVRPKFLKNLFKKKVLISGYHYFAFNQCRNFALWKKLILTLQF